MLKTIGKYENIVTVTRPKTTKLFQQPTKQT